MKKLLSLVLITVLLTTVFTACNSTDGGSAPTTAHDEIPTEVPTKESTEKPNTSDDNNQNNNQNNNENIVKTISKDEALTILNNATQNTMAQTRYQMTHSLSRDFEGVSMFEDIAVDQRNGFILYLLQDLKYDSFWVVKEGNEYIEYIDAPTEGIDKKFRTLTYNPEIDILRTNFSILYYFYHWCDEHTMSKDVEYTLSGNTQTIKFSFDEITASNEDDACVCEFEGIPAHTLEIQITDSKITKITWAKQSGGVFCVATVVYGDDCSEIILPNKSTFSPMN